MKKMLNRIKCTGSRLSAVFFVALAASPAYAAPTNAAATNPTTSINNLYTLIASIISAVGALVTLWGVVQLSLALKRHDPASASEGILGVAAGLILAFAPWIVTQIM